jgi:hypothetical protein
MASKRVAEFSPGSEAPKFKQYRDNTKFHTPNASTPLNRPTQGVPSAARYEQPVFEEDPLHVSMNSVHTPATSPEITRHSALTSEPLEEVFLEVHSKDNSPFDGLLPRDYLSAIWTDKLERSLKELRFISYDAIAGKYLRIYYTLKEPTPILHITKTPEIEFELKLGSKIHIFNAKFPQFKEITCELGKLTTVTFYKVPHGIHCEDLREWLGLFGEVRGNFRYIAFNKSPLS